MESLSQDLMREIECPVCIELMVPPITQCLNGHIICKDCRSLLQNCPSCNASFSNVRNLTAETLSRRARHACRFRAWGCNQQLALDNIQQHEDTCDYKLTTCLFKIYSNCSWEGPKNAEVRHMVDDHDFETIMSDNAAEMCTVLSLYHEGGKYCEGWYRRARLYNCTFLQFSHHILDVFYTCCYLINSEEGAHDSSYKYRMTLKTTDDSVKLVFEHVIPDVAEISLFPSGSRVAALSDAFIEKFLDPLGNLSIGFEIIRVPRAGSEGNSPQQ